MFKKSFAWFLTFFGATTAANALSGLGGLPKSGGTLESNLDADGNKITGLGAGNASGDSVEYDQFTTALGNKADSADLSAKLDANGGTWTPGYLGGNLDADGYKVVGLAQATAAGDAVEYSQFQAAMNGLDPKSDVYVAVSDNVNRSSPGSTLDGVSFSSPADLGKRVALVGQTNASQNGIYIWNGASSAMTRAEDADSDAEVTTGLSFFVSGGSNAGKQFYLSTTGPIVVGTTNLTFSVFTAVQLSNSNPTSLGTAGPGSSGQASRADHVHPVPTDMASTSGATFTGDVTLAALLLPPQVLTSNGAVDADTMGVVISCHSGNVTASLPAASGGGRVVFLKRYDMGSPDVNTCTIDADGTDTVEDETGTDVASITLANRDSVKLWDVVAGKWVVIP